MKKYGRKLFVWSPILFLLGYIFSYQRVNSHSSQPDAGHVKDPVNNQSCARTGCHSSYSFFNAPRANVTIGTTLGNQVPLTGFQYSTGATYIMQFTITSNSARYGFEMSALSAANTNAGSFSAAMSPGTTTVGALGGISYMGHKNAGTTNAWNFTWTSPASNVGNITFYTAVNKSNNSFNALGDSIFHQTFVITPPSLSASAGNDVTVCPGSATQLQATTINGSGTSTYSWSPATGLSCTTCANPVATPSTSTSTTYTVTVSNSGQTASDAVTVNTFSTSVPAINASANTVCPNSSVTLSSGGFNAYLWSTGGNTFSTSVTNGGTYFVTGTDANNCTTSNSVVIQQGQAPSPVISSSQPFLCGGNSATLSAGIFSTYQWSTNETIAAINTFLAGNYSVTVTNSGGCSASASFNLQSYSLPTANVTSGGPLTFCAGDNVTLTANAGTAYTYKWSTGATTDTITVSQSGAYIVTVYNPCDSAVSQIQNIVVNSAPNAQLTPTGPLLVCNGAPQTIYASPAGFTYKWLKDGIIVQGQTRDSLNINDAGHYRVVITQGTCTDTSDAVIVSASGSGNATVDITASQNYICAGDTLTLDAGSGFTTYSWASPSSTSQTVQITSAGTYIVSVTVNNGQCNATGQDTITVASGPALPQPVLSYDSTLCAGDTVTITVSPNTFTTYQWSTGETASSIQPVTGTYTVSVSASGFCGTETASINAIGTPLPDATFTVSNATLTANTSGASYQWYFEGSPVNGAVSGTYIAQQSGSYYLQVTLNGCSNSSAPQAVIINGLPIFNDKISLSVYPNPARDILKFNLELSNESDIKISVMSLDGRTITEAKTVRLHAGQNSFEEDLSILPEGVYVVYLQNEYFKQAIKIIKQNQ